VIYDFSRDSQNVNFSVFISSGPRPNVLTDEGTHYSGPNAVFTCFGWHASFDGNGDFDGERVDDRACSPELVAQLPPDAAFAEIELFDG
jgi:hypothetical protein